MKIKKILIISLILLTLSLTAVSANDINDTDIGESSCGDDSLNSSFENVQLEETFANTQLGTFNDLQVEINNAPRGSVLNLSRDYNGAPGSKIQLNKDLTIDGQGHTIDCLKTDCSAFYSSSGKIVLKNLIIKNGHNNDNKMGGAIHIEGSAKYTIENCTFENNWAGTHGGAIYNGADNSLTVINSKFNNNAVYLGGGDNFGGAIYSKVDLNIQGSTFTSNNARKGGAIYSEKCVEVKNSTFNDNTATCGGVIHAKIININNNLETAPFNTFFTANNASEYGGALYAEEYINAVNTIFYNNSAGIDGGAVAARGNIRFENGNINVRHCLFESNQAKTELRLCYGGAIRAGDTAIINNCTFKNNYADNKGGAVYAKDVTITGNSSFFEGNTAKDHGGAIYTDKFNDNVLWASFINNDAYSKDGGAIYINKENHVIFSNCYFERNKCGGLGGAIYFDSRNSGVILRYNIFIDNSAGKKGEIVYTCGKFNEIKNNWYGINNPDFNNKFTEWHWPTSDEDHSDADPVKTKLSLSDNPTVGQTFKLIVDFLSSNSNKLDGILYGFNARFNADNGASITNHQIGENRVTSDITFNNDGITNMAATINKQILKLSYSYFKENVTMNIIAPEITMGENATLEISFTPNTATGVVSVGNISSLIENGTAIVIIPNLPVCSNTLFVVYNGDYAFNNASASIVVVVNRKDLNINANAIPIHIGDNATVVVSGLENATGNVTVSINNTMFSGTIIDGVARVVTSGLNENVTANVAYPGDNNYNDASTTVDIIVKTDPKDYLTIVASAEPVNIPEDVIIVVTGLENATGNVTVSINNNNWTGEITDGTATVIVPGLTANVTANVTYAGDYKYYNASTTVDIKIYQPITVWYVNGSRSSSGDGKSESTAFKTLKEAINKASDGNTIYIMPNTYIGNDNVGLTINKNLNLIRYGDGEVILDAEGLARILTVNATSLNITGLTFKNGKDDYAGGAIFFEQTLENSIINATFINNALTYHGCGGAIAFYCDFNNSIINSDFINNTVGSGMGGAIYFNGNLNNVTLKGNYNNNSVEDSGGVFYFNGNLTDVIVSGDYANNMADYGGVYYICELVNVSTSTISGNYTDNTANYGAVIFSEGNIVNSKVYGDYTNNYAKMGIDIILFAEDIEISGNYVNNAISDGGVIYMGSCGDNSIIHDSIFINNNVGDEPIISALIGPIALNNWFGNNATNYNITPNVSENVTLINWLFLNATTNDTEVKFNDPVEIIFKLYSYNSTSEEIAEYDASKMNIKLDLTQSGGRLSKDSVLINETVIYTFDKGGIASVTGRFENTSYTLILAKESTQPGTFNDLQVEINNAPAGSVLYLSRDYYGAPGSKIQLNKDLIIDGQGHTLDCLNTECIAFYSRSGKIILKNLIIKNGRNTDNNKGGAIHIEGSAQYTIENCIFENNYAKDYGGAIYNGVDKPLIIINSKFNNNSVYFADPKDGGAIYSKGDLDIQCSTFTSNKAGYGGAIYSINKCVEIKNSTFNNNTAKCCAGAIYAKIININNNLETAPFNAFFIGNKANSDSNGAIYAQEYINAVNTIFYKNSAGIDGGAASAGGNINVRHCLFESNQAKTELRLCYGGAIRAGDTAIINNCTFKNNYADNKGGAVYAKDVTITGNSSFFEGNTAKDHGGAIYTDKFNENVCKASFINNDAYNKDGGAIYINKENHVIFSNCYFERNKCGGLGGAIYFDSRNSGVHLRYNIFIDNSAGKKGEIVYTCGKFNEIKNNWYGINNPDFNNKFTEWHWPTSDEDHSDVDPVKTKLSLSDNPTVGQTSTLTVDFLSSNSNKLDSNLYGINAKFNADNGATITNHQIGENSVTSDITFNNDGITTMTATVNKQVLKLSYSHFKENVTMNIIAPEITMGENATLEISFTPNTATGVVSVGNISSLIENGTAIVIIPNLPVGSNTLSVAYSGDGAYNSAQDSVTIVVNRKDLNINVNAIPIYVGDNATVVVSGLENATGSVTVNINNIMFSGNITEGVACVVISGLNENVTANVAYPGDNNYKNASTTVDIIVNTNPKKDLTIVASAEPVNIPEDVIVVVSGLENATGNVTVSINNDNWTGEIIGGTATVIVPGLTDNVTANVTYAGNYEYNNASTTVDIKIYQPITVWYVDGSRSSSGDGKSESTAFKTLKEAINKASDGNTIYIMPNTYTGNDNVGLTINKNLNIIRYGDGQVILDAENLVRILTVNATSLNITGLTFKNGIEDYAGAAIFFYQTLENSIINATFINNTLTYHGAGGAIAFYCDVNNSIINADFINNTVISGDGGALYFNGNLNNVTLKGTYNNNAAEDGGVFYLYGNLTDVDISGYYADNVADEGAVIFCEGDIANSTIYGDYNNNHAIMGINVILVGNNVDISGNYVNNTISDGSVIYIGYCDGNSIVHDSIFINNDVGDEPIISAMIDPIFALNNWFGNNATNYNITPNVSENVTLINWLFLNATTNATELKLNDAVEIIFKLYSYNSTSEEIAEYDASKMNIKLDLTQIGGTLAKDTALINETVMYTFDEGGIASVTGRFENVSYTLIFAKASSEIIINKTEITLLVNQSVSAEATLKPEVAGNLTYTSNDTSVAIVENGVIKALAEGTATITVSFAGNEYYDAAQNKTINVVVKLNGTSVTVNNSTLDLKIGETFTIVATTVPDGLNVTFVPDNSGVVSVDENGLVTALKEGTATIVVKVVGEGHYAENSTTVAVTVSSNSPPVFALSQNRNVAALYSAKANYKVLVTRDGKAVGAGETVTIKYNGKTYNIKTDKNGYATLKLNTKVKVKKYTITATYKGVKVTNKVTIKHVIKASNKKVKKSRKVTKVIVSLKKVNGKYLKGKILKIKFNKKTYKVKTNKKGKATWKVKKSMLKKLKVAKKYKYKVTYGKDIVTKKLTIKK